MSSEARREGDPHWETAVKLLNGMGYGPFCDEDIDAVAEALVEAEANGQAKEYQQWAAHSEPSTPAAKAGDGWIRCSERMPEEGKLVLVYETGWVEPAIGHHVGGVWFAEDDDDDQLAVTHWQPLPAPPSPETNGEA